MDAGHRGASVPPPRFALFKNSDTSQFPHKPGDPINPAAHSSGAKTASEPADSRPHLSSREGDRPSAIHRQPFT